MTKIKWNKGRVKRDIENQIDQGHELIKRFAETGSIRTYEDFLEARNAVDDWSINNSELLEKFFDDDLMVAEYLSLDVPILNEDQSRLEQSKAIRAALAQRIDWLNTLMIHVDELPQSEKTPTARWGH